MNLDAKICYCFHVSRRKLENFIKLEKPKVASMLSQCGGAGTGCGWCIPFLKQIHANCNQITSAESSDLETLTPEEYSQRRAKFIEEGKGRPPAV